MTKIPGIDGVWAGRGKSPIVQNGGDQLNDHTPPHELLRSNSQSNLVNKSGTPEAIRRATLWAIPIAVAICGLVTIIVSKINVIP